MRKALLYGTGLIALYLVVNYSSGTGNVLNQGSQGAATLVKTFQGR
jgi:hypothetical protein